jgi:hypothetical protein
MSRASSLGPGPPFRYPIPGPGFQVSGTRHRIRCSAFGSRPSVWTRCKGSSHLPHPPMPGGRTPRTEDRARPLENAPIGFARWESRTQAIAYCPIASPPPIGLTRPTGLAMMGVEASRDQVPRIGVKRERGANPLRSRRRDRGRKRRYATGSGHPVPPGKAARVGRSGSRKTCLVLLTGLLRGERP